jgi:hypothetical protein
LNGVPFHGRADLHNYMTSNPAGIADMKKDGTTMQRLWGSNIETPSSLVDVYDAAGMPVRYTGIFDGQGGAMALSRVVRHHYSHIGMTI